MVGLRVPPSLRGFDRLSPNGVGAVPRHARAVSCPQHPFALSLSKGRSRSAHGFDELSPNGVSRRRAITSQTFALSLACPEPVEGSKCLTAPRPH
jgi:hypothetical protein